MSCQYYGGSHILLGRDIYAQINATQCEQPSKYRLLHAAVRDIPSVPRQEMRGSFWKPCCPLLVSYFLFLHRIPCLSVNVHCNCLHTCLPHWPASASRGGVWKFLTEISTRVPSRFHLIVRVRFCEKAWSCGFREEVMSELGLEACAGLEQQPQVFQGQPEGVRGTVAACSTESEGQGDGVQSQRPL